VPAPPPIDQSAGKDDDDQIPEFEPLAPLPVYNGATGKPPAPPAPTTIVYVCPGTTESPVP